MNLLKNNSGMALIQVVMAGTAIVTGSFYLTMRNNVTLKTVAAEYYSMELFIFEERLKEVLVDNQTCRELFVYATDSELNPTYNPIRLNSSTFGLLASTDPNDRFSLGENNMFIVSAIRLRRAPMIGTAGEPVTEFVILDIDVEIHPNFITDIIAPSKITKSIPLFAYFDPANPNKIQECYYDPFDPERKDGIASGYVTSGIANLCFSGNGIQGGSIVPYMTESNDCYTPGLPLFVDLALDPAGTKYNREAFQLGVDPEGTQLFQLNINSQDYSIQTGRDGVLLPSINIGKQDVINFSYETSPIWIPNMEGCGPMTVVDGFEFEKINPATPAAPFGFLYKYRCRPLNATEIGALINTNSTMDCVNGFAISNSGSLRVSCDTDDAGVDRNGGGDAPSRP